jgi:cell fate regulator YaaT (PSP1 superfamily)
MTISKVQKQPKTKTSPVGKSAVQKQPKAKTSPAAESAAPKISASHDRIRERAFEIYESRGSEHGLDMQDWLHAEHQVLER